MNLEVQRKEKETKVVNLLKCGCCQLRAWGRSCKSWEGVARGDWGPPLPEGGSGGTCWRVAGGGRGPCVGCQGAAPRASPGLPGARVGRRRDAEGLPRGAPGEVERVVRGAEEGPRPEDALTGVVRGSPARRRGASSEGEQVAHLRGSRETRGGGACGVCGGCGRERWRALGFPKPGFFATFTKPR